MAGSFPRPAKLRDLQRELCNKFGHRFPSTMAVLIVGGRLYDQFEEQPFADCDEGTTVGISFGPTDNPFFYDEADRRAGPSLEEEVLWEEAVGIGVTTLDLAAWVASRRAEVASLVAGVRLYDRFEEKPFADCEEGERYGVKAVKIQNLRPMALTYVDVGSGPFTIEPSTTTRSAAGEFLTMTGDETTTGICDDISSRPPHSGAGEERLGR